MPLTNKEVAIILDPDFGEMLCELASAQAVWACSSAANRRAAETLWSKKTLPGDHVTIFDASPSASKETVLLNVLNAVDEHHPSWLRLCVIGVHTNAAISAALAQFQGAIKATADGFVYDRSAAKLTGE